MILCFTGTQGSGKTTLAQAVADKTGLPFYPSRASEIHQAFGVTGGAKVPLALRVRIQQAILSAWSDDYALAQGTGGVFDRCPVDFAAYMLADVQRDGSMMDTVIQDYVWTCQAVSARIKHLLMVKPLGIKLENRGPDKAGDGAFAIQVQMLIRGLLGELGRPFLVIDPGSLDRRVTKVSRYMSQVFEDAAVATTIEGSHYDGPEVQALH